MMQTSCHLVPCLHLTSSSLLTSVMSPFSAASMAYCSRCWRGTNLGLTDACRALRSYGSTQHSRAGTYA